MAEKLKRAAAWLGLVTDDRYSDYDEPDEAQELPKVSAARSSSVRRHGGRPALLRWRAGGQLPPLHPHPSLGRQTCPES